MPLLTTLPQSTKIMRAIESLLMGIGAATNCYNTGVSWSRSGSFENFVNGYNKLAKFEETRLAMRLSSEGKERQSSVGPTIRSRYTHEYVVDCIACLSKAEQAAGIQTDELVERAFEDFCGVLGANDNIPILTKMAAMAITDAQYANNSARFVIHRAMGHQVMPDGEMAYPFTVFQIIAQFDYDLDRRA